MTRTEQAAQVAPRRPRLVELDSLPATFSAHAPRGDHAHARLAPAVAPDLPRGALPAAPEPPPAEPQSAQALVRWIRKAANAAAAEAAAPPPTARMPARSPSRPRPKPPQGQSEAVDVTEELVAVVGQRLGLGAGALARSMYGRDTAGTRARVAALLDGLGPRGREVALELARVMLERL